MDKTAIKNFAIWARRKLISEITYKAGLIGITEKGISKPLPISTDNIQFFDIGTGKPTEISDHEIKQREALVNRIKDKESTSDYKTAFQLVIEEVAYTWFNRLIAIRFMEVNDYLPSRIRVLSSGTPGKSEPDMVTNPFDTDMAFSAYEKDRVMQLKHENELDELFRMLFIKQCNVLNEVLPELFEKTSDYSELLLDISFTNEDSIVRKLVSDINEEDYQDQVEIIGWLYQFYNSEPKAKVDAYVGKQKVPKEDIPAKTQLFTPDWIVRYMVENSLGRLGCGYDDSRINNFDWDYYIKDSDNGILETIIGRQSNTLSINPEEILFLDPCMGSGHVLVYAFEIFMQIYLAKGYGHREAAGQIISRNLYGIDIDDRAYQLSYFAIMMKGRKYDRRFFEKRISPNLCSISESNHLELLLQQQHNIDFGEFVSVANYLLDTFKDAKEYGSVINVDNLDYDSFSFFIDSMVSKGADNIFDTLILQKIKEVMPNLIKQAKILSAKYHSVVTNPPYFSSSDMSPKLAEYIKKNYPISKADMFAVFIEKCSELTRNNGVYGMIVLPSLVSLSSYTKLREKIINENTILNLLHMGRGIFGVDFGSIAFCIRKGLVDNHVGSYFKLFSRTFQYIDPEDIKSLFLVAKDNEKFEFDFSLYKTDGNIDEIFGDSTTEFSDTKVKIKNCITQSNFHNIPGCPFAYWVDDLVLRSFGENKLLGDYLITREGMATAGNERFLRLWHEVDLSKIGFGYNNSESAAKSGLKWFPYNKGGDYRKWYGNNDYIVNWANDGSEIKNNIDDKTGRIRSHNYNGEYGFQEGLTWSSISAGNISVRYSSEGYLFDSKGAKGFPIKRSNIYQILGLLNSKVTMEFLKIFSPTMDFKVGDIILIPFVDKVQDDSLIPELVKENILITKQDWDSFETSWDFANTPLKYNTKKISDAYQEWELECKKRLSVVKRNEESINKAIIEYYQLSSVLDSYVNPSDINLNKPNLADAIKDFISYFVGCLFGRYSLDIDGLVYAGGLWDSTKYSSFIPDLDNCVLITDEEYFEDDIVGRFIDFVRVIYGKEALDENLNFIANALGCKGDTSKDVIRNYFIKDFYLDHCKKYTNNKSGKRPIYWQFDSGKENGFKALVYMHRYTADTTGIVRVDYLHKMQKIYMSEIDRMKEMAENSNNTREVSKAEKRREKLIKQLKETKEYDEKIAHLALSRIAIDLDDGVKVNYEKIQTGQDGKKLDILTKI